VQLLVVLHNYTDDQTTVVFAVEWRLLQHDTQALDERHDAHTRLERRLCETDNRPVVELERVRAGNSMLERGSDLFVQLREEDALDKVLEHSAKLGHFVLEPGGHNGGRAVDKRQSRLEQNSDVEGVGGDKGAVCPRDRVAVVGCRSTADNVGLARLEVDQARNRSTQRLLERLVNLLDLAVDSAGI
jgi:hypothetical protein